MAAKKTLSKLAAAASQRTKEKNYWLDKLSGEWMKSRFPCDYYHTRIGGGALEAETFEFSYELSSRLMRLSKGSDVRLYIVLAAGLTALLFLCKDELPAVGQEVETAAFPTDIVVGTPILKQEKQTDFINTLLVIKNSVGPRMTFKELILEVRQTIVEAIEHQNYPMEILANQLNRSFSLDEDFPFFDIAVLLENIHDRNYLAPVNPGMIFSFARGESLLQGRLEYNPLLYREITVERIISRFKNLLREVLANAEVPLSAVDIIPEEEKKQLLAEFNDTSAEYPRDRTIQELFLEQVSRTPDSVAAVSLEQGEAPPAIKGAERVEQLQITYRQLNEKSDQLACLLRSKGIKPDSIVGIKVERSLEMIIGILGILKAGGAYLPIDPNYPRGRSDYMLKDSNAALLLTSRELSDVGRGTKFCAPTTCNPPLSLAYIIYTSGTTGNPKGVMVNHGNVINLVFGLQQTIYNQYPGSLKVALVAPYVFDASVQQIFAVLLSGHSLYIVPGETRIDGKRLSLFYREHAVDISDGVPMTLRLIVESGGEYLRDLRIRHFIIGGEALPRRLVEDFLNLFGTSRPGITNVYGPTECCVDSTWYEVPDEAGSDRDYSIIPIGKPMPNGRIYIMNPEGQLQPMGIPGELYIGGDGVGRGYLNQPELTNEKFLRGSRAPRRGEPIKAIYFEPNALRLAPCALLSPPGRRRLYKTGDLARWLPDGNIQFLGRLDHQVKIRGYRIELGEIEKQLEKHPDVKTAVVIERSDEKGDKEDRYLCAYVAADAAASVTGELKEFLARTLPDYMIPAYFVLLEKIPLGPSGKVDIKALPQPAHKGSKEKYIAPRDPMEDRMAEIWSEVLSVEKGLVGIDDNFFELGGHSLRATTLVSQIYKEFGVEIEIGDMFSHPTIRELVRLVKELEPREYLEIVPVEEKEHYELSFAQRRLWILCQFEEDSTAYNMPGAVMVCGLFAGDAFTQAVRALAERHESLRTVFISVNGEPRQKVIKDFTFGLKRFDLRQFDERAKEEETRALFRKDANRAFDLEYGPLFRFTLIRLQEEAFVLVYNFHHIINDGWSQGIINNEIVTLYNAFALKNPGKKGGETQLAPLKLQYKDYTHWHNRLIDAGSFSQPRHYWLEKFKDKPNGIELPLDYPRRPVQTFNGGRVLFTVDKEKTAQLRRLSLEEDVTLFMILLSLLNVFLYRYSGQEDIIIGAPIAARRQPELYQMIGFLVNTLIYRSEVNPAYTFKQLLPFTKKEALDCYQYQDYPFDLLVEELQLDRDLSQSPLFNVMLAHNNADTGDRDLVLEGVTLSPYSHSDDFNMSKFDLIFFMNEVGNEVHIRLEYNSDLFERSTIRRMAQNFLTLVDSVVKTGDVPISQLKSLADAEYKTVVQAFNDTRCDFPHITLQELFEQQAAKNPGRTAVIDAKQQRITYGELNGKSNRLAHYLREEYGVKPNDVIGVSLDRSIEMIVVLWGIIKSGAGYLAVDPAYPRERVLHVLVDSQAELLIIDEMRPELFGGYPGKIINVIAQWEQISRKSAENPRVINRPSDILYVNYTSGSTGTPNGAMLSHGILTNLIQWQKEKTSINCSLRCLQFTSINFCVSFQEIIGTLTSGGELYLIGEVERQDIDYLMDFLSEHQVEILFLPFSYLNFLFNESGRWNRSFNHNLKHIITAGEQLKITTGLKRFLDLNPGLKLHNHYGSTEMHVVTSYTLDASTAANTPIPPAGKPVSNVNIYILDDHLNPVPVGVWGELFVSGSSEVLGYINNTALTGKKLVNHPVFSKDGKRLYRSGDIGRWSEAGNIQLQGRRDSQVKVRGFRVEPGEIESKLLAVKGVKECVVVVKEDPRAKQKYLAAYVVLEGIDAVTVRKIISRDLPQYMMPGFVELERLPLMPNGKVDRERLPEPHFTIDADDNYAPPTNAVERKLVEIWSQLLESEEDRIGIDDNFFERGGHSLKATTMMSKIHKALNVKVELLEIFKAPTIRDIASHIRGLKPETFTHIEAVEEKSYYPVSSAQRRVYILQQMELESTVYNMPAVMVLEGEVREEKLENVFNRLIARHESLRTSFMMVDNEPVQRINKPGDVGFTIEYNLGVRPFDLSQAPLLRAALVKLEKQEHIFIVDMHHIISDGVSIGLLTGDFMALYGDKELPRLRIQYKDFSGWQNRCKESTALNNQQKYWLGQFDGDIPVLDLPTDFARPAVQRFEGKTLSFEIENETTSALKRIAAGEKATLYMGLLALYSIFLSKLSSQEDIIVGSPVAGRRHENLGNIIGMFVNTLVMRNYPAGNRCFSEFLKEVKKRTLAAFDNQDYQFEDLVENLGTHIRRDAARNPLFDVMFVLQNMDETGVEIPGLKLKPYAYKSGTSKFDLTLQGIEGNEKLLFTFEYSTILFREETIKKFVKYFKRVISSVSEDPEKKISEIEIIDNEEKCRLLEEFNDTEVEYPKDKTIHQLFAEQAVKTPDGVSIVGSWHSPLAVGKRKKMHITYGVLNEKADQLARYLRSKGVGADIIVGVMLERSIEMIIGVLGILKAGGAYLSIDPDYPRERIDYMLKDSNAALLLTSEELANVGSVGKGTRFCAPTTCNPHLSLAYVIYTSGSTGRPRGVLVEQRNVVRLVKNTNYVRFREKERILQTGALEFDASTFEIWGALLNGLSLYLVPEDDILDPVLLKRNIRKYDISTMWLTSPLFNRLCGEDVEIFAGLRKLLVGGDVLSPAHINRVRERFPSLNVINGYGPTENTTFSTAYLITKDYEERIPIGKPIANSTAYIVDRWNRLAPVGVVGELWVGGDGVSRGYLNNPELTAERFIYRSYWTYRTYRFYKTGDLARWLPDGNIEFIGRIDYQVKIRGFRIEPGEIESRLLNHHQVKEAVVLVREDSSGDKCLCAYVIALNTRQSPGLSELREYLSRDLPDYMVPSYIMTLDRMPLTPNGKVDRVALPVPGGGITAGAQSDTYTAPRNRLEQKLAEIWAAVLSIDPGNLSIDANFFEAGGHSLKATSLVSRIHKTFRVKLPLAEIFTRPTIREMSRYIGASKQHEYQPITPVELKNYYPLSSAQKRLYILQQMDVGSSAYNIPESMILEGSLEIEKFEDTFKRLIDRHESLRTSFIMVGDEPVQRVHDPNETGFTIEYDLEVRPFDLARAPLFRVGLKEEEERKHILMVDMHHIISDGTSMGVLVKEFMTLYEEKDLPAARIQYKDFSQWQNSETQCGAIRKQEEYWLKEFEGEIPVMNLPLDYPRPVVRDSVGGELNFRIDKEQKRELKALALEQESSLYMVLLSILNILLSKLSGQDDIVVGSPVAGRRHGDLENVIGMFVNTLALRNYPAGERDFIGFLKEVRERTLTAFENQDFQFEDLVENAAVNRDTSRNPLFDVMFVLQNMEISALEIPGLKLTPYPHEKRTSQFDMTWNCVESGEGVFFSTTYRTKLFNPETIERFIKYFKQIVAGVLENPGVKISDIEIVCAEEKERILYLFNDTRLEYSNDKTIHELFEEQAERTPGHTAVIGRGQGAAHSVTGRESHLSYGELNEKSNQLAQMLRKKGVGPDTIVGIMVERSLEMVIGISGILKSAGAYLPIDPNYPEERIQYMLQDSKAKILLAAPAVQVKGKDKKESIEVIDISERLFSSTSTLTSTCKVSSANLAYIIYTSGSTGKPKGVMVEHTSVVNLITALQEYYPLKESDIYLLKTNYIFDVSAAELFGWFLGGGRLAVLEKGDEKDPGKILETIERQKVTHINFVPSMFRVFLEFLNKENAGKLSHLRYIFLAGEVLSPESAALFKNFNTSIVLENIYGPTEGTVYSSRYSLSQWKGSKNIPIGKPLQNVRIYILDKWDHVQPIGVPGELYLSGTGLSRGYLNRPELTEKKFIKFHHSSPIIHRLYRSGDLVRWLPDGNIEFLGRIDFQVKIRGYRIEPEEIENRLLEHENIKEAVVLAGSPGNGKGMYICAYVVIHSLSSGDSFDVSELREYLAGELPEYMIPSYFIPLDSLPLMPNGKVNREALPVPEHSRAYLKTTYVKPESPKEIIVADIWKEVLGIDEVGLHDNFFELGGNSLNIVQLSNKLNKELGMDIPAVTLFRFPRISSFLEYLERMNVESELRVGVGEEKRVEVVRKGKDMMRHLLQRKRKDQALRQ